MTEYGDKKCPNILPQILPKKTQRNQEESSLFRILADLLSDIFPTTTNRRYWQ